MTTVGGGIAGLSAAWYAQQQQIDYTLIESGDGWGGKIQTEHVNTASGRVVVEWGPDAFITQKPWALQLAHDLGLDDQLLGTNDDQRQIYVWNRGRLQTLPDGLLMIIPTRFLPFALSSLISPLGKLRMGLEAFIPSKDDDEDESLADFVRRRLGQEALDKLAEPLMSGIYNTDAESQSLMATFPRFRALEQKYGSLTRGMLAMQRQRKARPTSDERKPSMFMSFKDGMQTLIDTLVDRLTGDCRLNTGLQSIEATAGGYRLRLDDGRWIDTQQVVLALPAYASATLLAGLAPASAALLRNVDYVSTGTLSLAYRKSDLHKVPDGFGVVIPQSAGRDINAITVSSTKFDHRAPDDIVLLRAFYGGARTPHTYQQDDETLQATVRRELKTIYGITADPIFTRVLRNQRATPQYTVGHRERVARIEAGLPAGLTVVGSPYHGVGVPDCVHQSQQAIERIAPDLKANPITEPELV